MTSQRRIEANRRNAARSTGPRTAEGKARSRMNGLRHGARRASLLGDMDDPAGFRSHRRAMLRELSPATPEERILAEEVILQGWRLNRAQWMEARLLDRDLAEAEGLCPQDTDQASHEVRRREESIALGSVLHRSLSGPGSPYQILSRLEVRMERSYRRLLSAYGQCRFERLAREVGGGEKAAADKKSERPNPTTSDDPSPAVASVSTSNTVSCEQKPVGFVPPADPRQANPTPRRGFPLSTPGSGRACGFPLASAPPRV
jgi:hypothetical protein